MKDGSRDGTKMEYACLHLYELRAALFARERREEKGRTIEV